MMQPTPIPARCSPQKTFTAVFNGKEACQNP
jgi:hypothetical protein